ncbi:irregular chiasm C-roughest protein-like isoform X1 [Anticarsia gemmatalis]|uniref:irregular chiasm C-roughest protein-like isoform X1 n=2 Tax=Anticarsia gemmatalis TaxID=129554 RepID=UPI003F75B366
MAAKYKETFENETPFIGLRGRRSEFKIRTERRRKWTRPNVGVVFLLLIALVAGCHGYQEQRFAMEPQDQSAIVGSRVTLPCRVENKAGSLQWTKDDFGLGTHRNLSGYDRYAMIGSDDEGDYSLDIKDVTLDDDGQYQCQVSSGLNGAPAIRSRYAQLTVLVAPEAPRIPRGAFIDATENQYVDIECVSSGGKPAAEITWLDGNQSVIKKHVKSTTELLPDGQRYKTRSVLRLTPSKSHHNQTITCQAQNTADRAPRMATVHIEVKYAPKVNVTISSGGVNDQIPEGSELRVQCDVDANPPAQVYRWFINDNPVIGDYTEEMIIFNVTRKHHNAVVKCEVSNSVGKNEGNITLQVTYPPTFRTRPQNVEADTKSTVTLRCDVDGQPQPKLKWLFHEPGRIEQLRGRDPTLKIRVSGSTAGRYICKASVDGYPEIESEATVFIKSAPKIRSNRTQFGMEGEYVTIECIALSVPKPDDITWYFENREINIIEDPDYAIVIDNLPDGMIKSSLVIRTSQSKHYGQYNCSVTNEYGNANVAIMLKPLKSLPLYIILIGVTSGIIIFSAFIILVVVCHRRRRKKGQMNEKPDVTVTTGDMYKESDRSSNISDLKPQLPHSDGSYELDYTSSDRSDSKIHAGLPLAGPVQLPNMRHDDPLMQFRYSNDYSDPTYSDPYFKNPAGYVYDYPQGYAPPPHLRVQSPGLDVPPPRSLQGSLTRSIDTASTLPMSTGNGSQNNTLQRTNKSPDETDAINNLGLPVAGEAPPPAPIYAQPNAKPQPNVDLRYAATYGNPYLRNSNVGYGSQVHTAKPAATPAPPPYSAVRSSVVIPTGNGQAQATHV